MDSPSTRQEVDERLHGEAALAKIRELLKGFRAAVLLTRAADSHELHARPLALQGEAATFSGTLWFFVDDRSRKAQEVRHDPDATLIFQSDERSVYLQLLGTATIEADRARMRALYSIRLKTWFPEGLDDPHLTLLRFDAESGAFWDNPGGMLRVLAAFTKAVVTGEPGRSGRAGTLDVRE